MAGEIEQQNAKEDLFGVIAELAGRQKQLVLLNLTFGRLIDDIVVPYEAGQSFFVDGVPLTRDKVQRIKIVKLGDKFRSGLWEIERGLNRVTPQNQKVCGDLYETRFDHVLRTDADDVTAQVIKAFNQAVKPSIKDYIPKRQELISAATTIFVEGLKALAR